MKTGRLARGALGFVAVDSWLRLWRGCLWTVRTLGVMYATTSASFPSWLWPILCTAALFLIWLYSTWLLVIRPVRHERLYGSIDHQIQPGTPTSPGTEGWFQDPSGLHEFRWFSVGKPTDLVKDDGIESRDLPSDPAPSSVDGPES